MNLALRDVRDRLGRFVLNALGLAPSPDQRDDDGWRPPGARGTVRRRRRIRPAARPDEVPLRREELTPLVERYFSLFLSDIRAEAGDINETAGDGLMILFQTGQPEHAAAAVRAALAIRDETALANLEAGEAHP